MPQRHEVHDLVGAVEPPAAGPPGARHRNRQGERHDEGDRNVEVFAHQLKLLVAIIKSNKSLLKRRIIVKMESGCLSGVFGFR